MSTLYIGKGKKDKISKGDIVGFLCKSGGLRSDEIGRIDVKDRYAYVAVKREKVRQVLRETRGEKIKGIKTIVEHCDATLWPEGQRIEIIARWSWQNASKSILFA